VQDAVPKEREGVPPAADIKNVPFRPPGYVFVKGRQVGIEIVFEEMAMIGGSSFVKRGIMSNYTDWSVAMRYFQKRKRYCEYTASPSMMKIFNEKIKNMLKISVIVETPYEELIWINPCHLVPKVNGDQRLVMDMTKVNKFMKPISFKMEGISTLSNLLTRNDYATSFDLKEAYNHIPVHASIQPLLRLA
jgi:hypothetical protein